MNTSPIKSIGKRECKLILILLPNKTRFIFQGKVLFSFVGDNVYVPPDMVFQTTDDLRLWQAERKDEFEREVTAIAMQIDT